MAKYLPRFAREVDAVQWDGSWATETRLKAWLGESLIRLDRHLIIDNRNGRVQVRLNDWIVDLGDGFYVFEPILFAAMYREAP